MTTKPTTFPASAMGGPDEPEFETAGAYAGNINDVLTPITTLEKLAAEGKFVSASHRLPLDWATVDWELRLDGHLWDQSKRPVQEVYTPEDGNGWAIVYDQGKSQLGTTIVPGRWTITKLERVDVKP